MKTIYIFSLFIGLCMLTLSKESRAQMAMNLTTEEKKANEKLQKIRERILSGEDFCKLAAEISQDAGARHCGQLGAYTLTELVPEYADVVSRLKPGEISPIVRTRYGLHIIQLISVEEEKYDTRHILIRLGQYAR